MDYTPYKQTKTYRQIKEAEKVLWKMWHDREGTDYAKTALCAAAARLDDYQRGNEEFYERMVDEGRDEIVNEFKEPLWVPYSEREV